MTVVPVIEEIQWSRDAVAHLALLQQSIAVPAGADRQVTPQSLKFEAVSIRPLTYPNASRFACRGIDGTIEPRTFGASAFGNVTFRGQIGEGPMIVPTGRCLGQPAIRDLIAIAFDVPPFSISGGPEGLRARPGSGRVERYSIEAKAEDISNVTKEQLRLMLQSMLTDRFKLKFHWETTESDGFGLVVGKNGPKLKQTSGEKEKPHDIEAERGGPIRGSVIIRGKSTLQALTDHLLVYVSYGQTPVPVIDKTGLTGIYEYTLILQRSPTQGGQRGGPASDEGFDPPISIALEQQLGLRLQPMKVQIPAIVVDQLEIPSEN